MIPHEVVYCTTVSYYNEEVSNYLLPIPTGVFVSFPLTCVHCACEDLVHAYNHQAAFLTLVLCIGHLSYVLELAVDNSVVKLALA